MIHGHGIYGIYGIYTYIYKELIYIVYMYMYNSLFVVSFVRSFVRYGYVMLYTYTAILYDIFDFSILVIYSTIRDMICYTCTCTVY